MANAITLKRPAAWKPPDTKDLARWHTHTTNNIARLQDAVNVALTGNNITNIYDQTITTVVGLSLGYRIVGEVNFGTTETDSVEFSITGLPWITSSALLHFQFTGGTTDHPDFADAMLDQVTARVTAITEGSGFTALAYAPYGTWGNYKVHIIGVI